MLPFVLVTLAGLAALLLSEWRGLRAGVWIAKLVASTGFLGAALAAGAMNSSYGRFVFAGLALSWLGDLLLIPKQKAAFLGGLVAFLLGHVAYATAFVVRGVSIGALVVAAVLLAVPLVASLRWLGPHVKGAMQMPVRAYVAAISSMVMCAAGTVWKVGDPVILLGAAAFYVSDLAVARDHFVVRSFTNKLWGLPLYFGAQLLLAWTVAGH
jgi:uncharacterized membrane protein YhhN